METVAPRICFPPQTQCLDLIRSFCRQVLEGHSFDPQVHRKLILAIDEAVANVIEHAYTDGETGENAAIELTLDVQPDRVVARILDRGRPFDPRGAEVAAPARPETREFGRPPNGGRASGALHRFPMRGFGLHLIRLIIDEIEYERTAQGENVLTLTKHIRKD